MSLSKKAAALAGIAALVAGLAPATAQAVEGPGDTSTTANTAQGAAKDNLDGPFSAKQRALRLEAQRLVHEGKAKPNTKGVVQVGSQNFVETTAPKSDKILTMLAEFGGTGPAHNQIPEPDRTKDNSTLWQKDFSPAYFSNLFNGPANSMKDFYEKQSNGLYSVTNQVENWVTVPGNQATYGANSVENSGGAWNFVKDTGNSWYDAQIKAGKTPAQIDDYLSQFDVWDRYDYDGDGNFNEPDGYIDHFQAVHSGEGEEAGASADAIWSHRWYAFGNQAGQSGPSSNLAGGTRIGSSKYWIGDYTTEPENGGLGVFAHEFGHDLGLKDYYDTTNQAENGTGFWTIMSAGSWLGRDEVTGMGDEPGGFGPDEKLYLGWLRGSNVPVGSTQTRTLNPSQLHVTGQDQAVRVDLPNKQTREYFTPVAQGRKAWWSGSSSNLNGSLATAVPARNTVTVTSDLWWDTEEGYDFLYPEYSLDGGRTWKLATNTLTGKTEPITGTSGNAWVPVKYQYSPNGQASIVRFRYQSDGAVNGQGALIDSLRVDSDRGTVAILKGESAKLPKGVTVTGGWTTSKGYVDRTTERYYLVENRQFTGYDAVLKTGPYYFGSALTRPDWVQFFSYTPGVLVWSIDRAYDDNNTSEHPGAGMALPVDARISPIISSTGALPQGGRRQGYDATFGVGSYAKLCLPKETASGVVDQCAPAAPQISTFSDADPNAYYDAARQPYHSVQVSGRGVTVQVTGQNADGSVNVTVVNPS
jgi:immune inhibitor A